MDTGANKNFISVEFSQNAKPIAKPFKIQSAAGEILITLGVTGKFFESAGNDTPLNFYVLPGLKSFDGIIGDDTLKQLNAVIDRKNNTLKISPNIKIPLKAKESKQVNSIAIKNDHLCDGMKEKLRGLLEEYSETFGPINDSEMVETNVRAEIRTTTSDPIYTKSYPYPVNLRAEAERQISEMLANGIIRPSNSAYNSPTWIVPKKPNSLGEKQYRLVVDFKRLNAVTIPDTYPIPDITNTLASFGRSKYFTTLDLTSGFHQIRMKEDDIAKTAFSTANGKYEFTRLPFGLKNAPAIFQRMIDDVLKPFVGKICYVYIDDIIILGETEEQHLGNLQTILGQLKKANLKVNLEKSKFLRTQVEFLGYVICQEGILPDPNKIAAIRKIKPPTNLKDLKAFLGLASYYRKFIRDFAKVAKPLTNITRNGNAQVKANQSKKKEIKLGPTELQAFDELKELLTSSEVLAFPDFEKAFILTTDASNHAIGAVLSQGEVGSDRPIIYVSRSLNKTEENYATNEKELLAIVWALDKLRTYLYGAKKIKILTDHQPLTFALSNSNNNAKLKRWKSRIEEYNYELLYKPGKTNVVADALSRLPLEVNILDSGSATMHSAEEDSTDLIPHTEAPINVFKNQLIISLGKEMSAYEEPHPAYNRHFIQLSEINKDSLTRVLKERLNPNVVNGIKIPEVYLQLLQEVFKESFSKFKIRITQRMVQDIANEENKVEIIQQEHRRAHRNHKENKEQILERYYFPKMTKEIKKYVATCDNCNRNKYDRHPAKPELQETPFPEYPIQILHMEISGEKYLTCKFAKFFHLKNKSVLHLRDKLIKVLHYFSVPELLVSDNEPSFVSPTILNYLEALGITVYLTPPQKSEVNGTAERLHSTILELLRCIRQEYPDLSLNEAINVTVDRYNNSFHSVTGKKPVDIFFARSQRINYQKLLDFKTKLNQDVKCEIMRKQKNQISKHNSKRTKPKAYKPGDVVFKVDKQIKAKSKPLYKKETVAQDNRVTITTTEGREVHKSHLKNIPSISD